MSKPNKHYDAWGNAILPHDAMLIYYRNDNKSLETIKRFMPCRLVVLPDVVIRINLVNTHEFIVSRVYPGETITDIHVMTDHALKALRTSYKGRNGWDRELKMDGWVVLYHRGKVIVETAGKYFPRWN